jgi:hypothetical protein
LCTPTLTITETRPGGLGQFEAITAGINSVTVDAVNSGTGLQGYSVVSATNAVINIPAFTPGTVNPVTATFTVPNPGQAVDFTLRATARFSGVLIRAQCGGIAPTPTPTPTPTSGVCTPMLTVTETRPGGLSQFDAITAGAGSVTVDIINLGTGLQGFSLVSATNATVNIPAFPIGTFNPVTATFTVPNTSQPVDFTLRATTRFSGVLIRAQCGAAAAPMFSIYAPDMSFWMPDETTGEITDGSGLELLGPTAVGIEISGRVLTSDGRGLRNALVTLVSKNGVFRTVTTGPSGYYRFATVEGGGDYIVGVASKRYRFTSRVIQVFNTLADIDFVGLE